MSHTGKLLRGEKWYNHRDRDNVLPAEISEDPAKMKDVNYFLENKKGLEAAKVTEDKTKSKKVK